MNSLLVFLIGAALLAAVSASHRDFDSESSDFNANSRLMKELEMEMEMENAMKLSRARRVPSASDSRSCGKKLVMFVLSVCGESCSPKNGHDIATLCCSQQCSEDFIKTACCPH